MEDPLCLEPFESDFGELWGYFGGLNVSQGVLEAIKGAKHGSTAAPRSSGGEDGGCNWARPWVAGAPLARLVEPMLPTGSQNGSKMEAKSGPGQTVKTVLPPRRELT